MRECRVFRCDRGDYTRVLPTLCARGCGCGGHPAFPTPSVFQGRIVPAQLGRIAPRERGVVSHEYERATLSLVIARGKRAIQYSRDVDNGIEMPQRTGYPACTGYDNCRVGSGSREKTRKNKRLDD